uniref:PCI domain-containing protein n=1 Tax=Chromera velia CCMP2878 TaxID=1169474 RepID=A0A0G4HBL7_9ALVE|eukprot:Cvel_26020.t1-p1 / transcript=Cvel_26020.t1 / gene=Cvel_26020 / organism=Chromera_velia_CCMP2878 / gene_product=COP9 signalosome complex subunit 7, putative / transcript_product=COP9 signalosome complex subunit 7, putative / location=Cvel_scaffold3029:13428-16452(-) / protein_length=351 / sequence_SO=supercontig / SO=protein_coding / is_pseudo=false
MTEASPLEGFLALASSATGKAMEHTIKQVIEHKGIFVFAELLEHPSVQKFGSQSPENRKWVDLLRVFAFGTLGDFRQSASSLPPLSESAEKKLKLLTLVSMASRARQVSYSDLRSSLCISTDLELEALLIEALYAELIEGKLDQEARCLDVTSTFGRDVRPEEIREMREFLSQWNKRTQAALNAVQKTVEDQEGLHAKFTKTQKQAAEQARKMKYFLRDRRSQDRGDGFGSHAPPPGPGGGGGGKLSMRDLQQNVRVKPIQSVMGDVMQPQGDDAPEAGGGGGGGRRKDRFGGRGRQRKDRGGDSMVDSHAEPAFFDPELDDDDHELPEFDEDDDDMIDYDDEMMNPLEDG